MSSHSCLVLGVLFTSYIILVHSEIYEFCNNFSSNVVSVNDTSPPVIIRSPKFCQNSHTHHQHCSLAIKSGKEPLILFLHFKSFDLEYKDDCNFDYLCVHGVKFCGNWTVGHTYAYIIPENSVFTLEFKTDVSVIRPGFQIKVTTQRAINQTIQQVTGGVGTNESRLQKTTVRYHPGFFYTDRCTSVPHIYNKPTTSEPSTSPGISTMQGVFYFCGNLSSNIVMINANSPSVIIRSPPTGNYGNNQICSLIIREPLILFLNYSFLDLVYQDSCDNDSLCNHGVKFCGIRETNQAYVVDIREMCSYTVKIHTDSLVTRSGFQIQMSQELTRNKSLEVATDGFGAHKYLNYTDVTYYPKYPFKDRCMSELNPTDYLPESKPTIIGQFVQEQISALINMAQMQASQKSVKV